MKKHKTGSTFRLANESYTRAERASGERASVGAVSADMCQGRYPGEMVASAPVGDAEVMPGLGPVPLGRWKSATEER